MPELSVEKYGYKLYLYVNLYYKLSHILYLVIASKKDCKNLKKPQKVV